MKRQADKKDDKHSQLKSPKASHKTKGLKTQRTNQQGDGFKVSLAQSPQINNNSQLDLFSFEAGLYSGRETVKFKPCLDCGEKFLPQTFSLEKKIYVGNRICADCKATQKNRFALI